MAWNRSAKSFSYRRNLPHLQKTDHAVFVTFRTYQNLQLSPAARSAVMEHILYENGRRIRLHGVVVMPNHVHLLFTCLRDEQGESYTLAQVLNSVKGASAHHVNRILLRHGHVWQDESFDHVLRGDETIGGCLHYFLENAAMLSHDPTQYPWLWREATAEGGCATSPQGD